MSHFINRIGPLVLTLALTVALTGCGSTQSNAPQPSSPDTNVSTTAEVTKTNDGPSPENVESADTELPTEDNSEGIAAANDLPTDAPLDTASIEEVPTNVDASMANTDQPVEASAEPEQPNHSRHRFIVMAAAGPIIVDLLISIGGNPLDGILDGIVDDMLATSDTDENGRVSWQELFGNDALRERYSNDFTLPDPQDDAQLYQLTQRYDANRNSTADRFEIPRLFSQSNFGAKPFTLRGSNYYREFNRYQSAAFRQIDKNRNGKLDPGEIKGAHTQLLTRDFNNDQHIAPDELGRRDAGMSRNNDAEFPKNELDGETVCEVGSDDKLNVFRYALRELYMNGDELGPECFALTPSLFGQLDIDENIEIDQQELARVSEVAAHITVSVDFGNRLAKAKVLRVHSLDAELDSQIVAKTERAGWFQIRLPATTLNIFLQDPLEINSNNRDLLQLLSGGDQDKNEQLSLEEFEAIEWLENVSPIEFATADRDKNGFIDRSEATYLAAQDPGVREGQVHCRVRHDPDALFGVLDRNADSRLNPREIRLSKSRLLDIDSSGDGLLDIDEVPDAISIGIWRGEREPMPAGLFTSGQGNGDSPQGELPIWFDAMDVNGDGEIGRSEFLGKPNQFGKLDANADGYVTIDEVEALTTPTDSQ